jgi:diaminopimelate decarboxylase
MAGPLPRHLLPDNATTDKGRLAIGGCDALELAAVFGTPLFVYDGEHLRARCREAVAALPGGAVYATKAFHCIAMARLADEEGMLLDVASGGEMHVALAAGVLPDKLVLHGNAKSDEELAAALEVGVGRIVVDSFDEMDRLDRLAGNRPAPVLVRITPGVEAHTHRFTATGHDDTKFGFTVSSGAAAVAVERARESPSMELRGLHAHIGSQVFRLESFERAARIVAAVARPFDLPELSMGGGLGVPYVEGEKAPGITDWIETIKRAVSDEGLTSRVLVEPGRAIVATAAVTLYSVMAMKEIPGIRTYLAVDGGMSDNPRPVLYGSGYETFLPSAVDAPRPRTVTVVGKHCESGDVLVEHGSVPDDISVGDILATPVTGAYGHSMGSTYNKVPRPAVVFCSAGSARLVVRRETNEDLLRLDIT